ncbi:Obscurin, partial [Nibea albiflora]
VTLRCFYKINAVAKLYWYKQTLGQKPKLISTFTTHDGKSWFYDEFKNNARFELDTGNNENHLKISDLQISDSATYSCFSSYYKTLHIFDIFQSITISVKGSGLEIQLSVHQSASESIQPGGSVTLNCTVHTGTCDGEHSVYWFKHSEQSHPGLIYTHGGRNDQCESKPNTQTHTCVYNLPMKSLNLSHAGTYYCAVASCGHILFGNGTKLDFEGSSTDEVDSLFLVYFWRLFSAFTTILVVLLAFSVCMMNKTNSCRSSAQVTELKYSSAVPQENFLSVKAGNEVTLRCFYKINAVAKLYWYKQTLGQKPKLISTFTTHDGESRFYDEFKNNARFKLDTGNNENHLKISDLQISDSATYSCFSSYYKTLHILDIFQSITVSVKGSGLNIPALVHQSASESIQPGGSVTLNCTVHTGTCDGEHSVYWFKHSEESHPGLIYTHGGRNDQCESKPNTQTHTCVYNLPMKSLNLSHAGTYYCAVASCGHILFGNGTKLDFEGSSTDEVDSLFLVYFLSGALTFTTILVVLLAFSVCMMNKRNKCQCTAQVTELKSSSSVLQESGFLSVTAGDELTLQCFYERQTHTAAKLYWYKQTLGQKPRLISSFYGYDEKGRFREEFKDNPRFTLDTGNGKNHLKISDLQMLDSATYYCVTTTSENFAFAEVITVSVKDSGLNIPALVHQSASESIQPGGSVTLNCTVHTGTCDGEHSVYWFKHSEESHPGLIYTHGGSNDQCESKPNTQKHTCVYNLPMKSLNLSHAGTYYCAVASCGRILFGNGTKLDFEGSSTDEVDSLYLVYFLSGALTFTTILVVLLAFSLYKMNKRNKCQCTAETTNLKLSSSVRQETSFLSVQAGENLILQCFKDGDVHARLYWYKQTLGEKMKLICSYYKYETNDTFYDEFKNNSRFTLDTGNTKNHLTITNLHISDSATYICIHCYLNTFKIAESITVSVKGSGLNIPALVHQSASESIQPGGSVTLNCTVHTGTCDGEHSVYWFKHSEESHPGLIYTHGGSNDQCESKPNTQTHTCVYNLPMKSLNLSHAGTYYCAVASCGHILFGNGTKLDFEAQVTELKSSSSVLQESGFLSVTAGDELTLQCFYEQQTHTAANHYWYKQTLGQKPGLISCFYSFDSKGTFYEEFKDNPRFTLDTGNGKNHLRISDLRISDSATYYCASSHTFIFKFSEGITVSVKGSGLNIPASVHQSASESIQPGGSVTLNCTVHTGTCDGEHSVYWFKHSEESHPGLIYTHGGRNDQCESKPNTQTHTCVYNLPMKSLNLSHAGTYYCAVASCGHILFGNGTKLDFERSSTDEVDSLFLVYFLSGALTFTTILVVLLAFTLYKMIKRNKCQCTGLIYTHGGRNDQCESKPNTQTHTCVYNLPMKSLNLSHAGTYYCAVASCGHILFGNGTKLDFETETTNLELSSSVRQETSFLSVQAGENLTLQCFSESNDHARLYWYKQTLGKKPRLICSYYKYDINVIFYDEFKDNSRFTLDTGNSKNHLTITDLHISDSATYSCIHCYFNTFEIAESITVNVKGSGLNIPALVHQSASESIQPGGSVTLNCTVHTGTCDGEHSVYWFKHSEESHPGLIYTHGGRNDQCESKPNTQTHTCVYNLPMKSLNLSHAGTYYCAVASCGHILFGNGTKLDFERSSTDEVDSLFLVYFWRLFSAFTTILVVLLAFSVCMMNKTNSCRSSAQTAALKFPMSVNRESDFVSFNTGDSLTLQCFYDVNIAARLYWYKHTVGQKPKIISTFYLYDKMSTFYDEFKDNPRFTVDTRNGTNHLTITDLSISDSATYYCLSCYLYTLEISESVTVSVKGSGLNIPALVHQSASESIQPGGSVTLNCTVHTGTCDGEHSVYWFKHSEESHPGLIYTHGGRNDQCESKPNTQTHTCVYNLPMKSLNLSHAGTYYCAVASCGHILFGNGTKLDFEAHKTNLKLSSPVLQETHFVSAETGDNLILQCFQGDVPTKLFWFKQTLGEKPRLICSYYKYETNVSFYDEFKNNPRFTLDTGNSKTHLTITDLHISDSAIYYCVNYLYTLEFSEITTVSVKGSGLNIPALVHQSASESIQPGGSVTLNCTVHTGTCDGEHSVYWFKHSEESHPGLIYTHGGSNDQCESKPNTQTHTCVYNLPMKSLNLSHAGTYYCAVASCGHILFGNGTKLDFEAQATNLKFSPSVRHESGFALTNVGENVPVQCFYDGNAAWLYWYKQTLGQKPRLISTFYKYDKKGFLRNELENNTRFSLDTENGKNHLRISNLRISDSATYYCASSHTFIFKFSEGITVNVKGSGLNIPALVHQSASESIQPGGSVTLNCTVHTGTCDGEHSVYWFKHSEESHPGLIYTHGGSNDQCESKPNTQTHTCVYNLPMKSLNLSHAGTYYCAVASCGHILFGNGTKLDFEVEEDSLFLVYFLSGTLASTNILVVLLAFSVYKMNKKKCCQSTGLIYTHGGRNDQCESKPNTQTHTCVYNLPMKSLNLSHAGTYYCAVASCGHILFGNGTKLDFEDEVDSLVLVYFLSGALAFTTILSVLLTVLLCVINKRYKCKCTGLIYTHGGSNDQCESKPNTQTHTCVYNLPMKSLNLSHAGTYYCAVASCGHILFGNGTKLDFEHEVDSLVLVYFLSGALAFTTILSVLLAVLLCVINKRNKCKCTGTDELMFSLSIRQERGFISANVGDKETLRCFYGDDIATRLYWYKQRLGEKPRLISTFYKYEKNGSFYNEFKNNPRFALDTGKSNYHLKISDLHISDSATYYCASSHTFIFEFAEGITVNVKGSGLNIPALVHQSASESIQPGGSVTLNCTVHTGTCDGEHSVYWFKHSEESHPGLIYTHGGSNDQCESKPNTQTHTCVYNLPMKSLNLSHAGTYYCAVASCGHILFGNGTKLDFERANMISDSVVQQPESQSVQPGGSVTLNCSVRADHWSAEHTSVTWLKSSHHSAPQMIYSSGIKNHTCQRSESGEATCVFDLLMKNLSSDDAGTYYCAVSSCGQTLFGNGTRIHVHNTELVDLSPTTIALMLSNILLGIVMLILIWTLCKIRRKGLNYFHFHSPQTSEAVLYAAVRLPTRSLNPRRAKAIGGKDAFHPEQYGVHLDKVDQNDKENNFSWMRTDCASCCYLLFR